MPARKKKTKSIWDDIPEPLWPYHAHGVEWSSKSKAQWIGTAPFSERERKFHVNPDNGLWDEKQLSESGNLVSFLEKMDEEYVEGISLQKLRRLAKSRGLPSAAFRGWGLGHDGTQYYMAVRNGKARVHDIRRFNPTRGKRWMSTKGCKLHLGNGDKLARARKGSTVYVTEGEFDAIALKWFLKQVKQLGTVVYIPGTDTLKKEWVHMFKNKDVVLCFDNDSAGDNGATKARKLFHENGIKARYLNWPEHWTDGYDINDFVAYALSNDVPLDTAWEKFESLIEDVHRRDDGTDSYSDLDEDKQEKVFLSKEEAPDFDELVSVYSDYLSMDEDMLRVLKIMLAVVYSQQIGSREPLWMYVVAPAGGGKTVMLSALSNFLDIVFRSTITANSLVSGFQTSDDPSLLPKLTGKTLVIKDLTRMAGGMDLEWDNTQGILRDAYDGDYIQQYGNKVKREYHNLHFSMLAGVTPIIHSKSGASMGERVLKTNMGSPSAKEKRKRLKMAMLQSRNDKEMADRMAEVTSRFLARQLTEEDIPLPPDDYVDKLVALATILSALRAEVSRDRYDRDTIHYRPEIEMGTRPFKQLLKLSQAVYFTLRKDEYDVEVLEVVQSVALDSCIGFNVEILKAMMDRNNPGVEQRDIYKDLNLSLSTVDRRMQDLKALGLVRQERPEKGQKHGGRRGKPPFRWYVHADMAEVWLEAGLGPKSRRIRAVQPKAAPRRRKTKAARTGSRRRKTANS